MAYQEQQRTSAQSGVTLAGRIDIFPTMPLPELNTPGGLAYVARYKADASSNLYAIICQSKMPPRIESVQAMKNIDNPGVLRLADAGVIQWTDGSYAYAFVYQRPTAPPLMGALDGAQSLLSEDAINRHFIAPMISSLTSFSNVGIVHSAIRPQNIFWRYGTAVPPQLGECLSVPAGVGQPVVFEPVERALATPLGRGAGTYEDDCYSFGVTLAFLALGRNPLQGMDDRAIIELKMHRGSFGAIVGNSRLQPSHIEILRGLLADDSVQRWGPSELDQWLNGRRMTPKSSDAGRRAARHFSFLDKEYWQVAPLVDAMANNPLEATKVIENDSLKKWLLRAMNDKERSKDLEEVIDDLKQSGKTAHYEDQLVARTAIALDSSGPIRYRGVSAMPSGLPTLLFEAVLSGGNVQIISEIIVSNLASLWIHMQKETTAEYIALGQLFDRMKSVMEKSSYGNGIERAIYEANQGLPCLSPMLKSQYVTSPKFLLPALERIAASGKKGREPMDRHIAAFLLVRERRSESAFVAMNAPEDSVSRGLGLLTLFSDLQYKYGPENLPNIASWLSPVVEPSLRRYLSNNLREILQKKAKELIAAGNLTELLRLIDDPRRLERDKQDFYAARLLYLNIQKEILFLEEKNRNREALNRAIGKPSAVSLSSFLAVILICVALGRVLLSSLLQ